MTATRTRPDQHTILELCAGFNGLGRAVEEVFDAIPVVFSEFDPHPARILKYHYPDVPNYGDMTIIDWVALHEKHGPITIVSGGTPCQDLSGAGRRRGMVEGTRSNLWVCMREAIAILQPEWVVWENVRGAYSAKAASASDEDYDEHQLAELGRLDTLIARAQATMDDLDEATTEWDRANGKATRYLEQRKRLLGRDDTGHLRALGRVLGDLSDLGYDTEWRGLRAADVGAPHGRFRVFVLAHRRATVDDPGRAGGREAIEHDGRGPAVDDRAGVPDESDRVLGGVGPVGGTPGDAAVRSRVQRGPEGPRSDRAPARPAGGPGGLAADADDAGVTFGSVADEPEHPAVERGRGNLAADTVDDGLEGHGTGGLDTGHGPAQGSDGAPADAVGEHRGQRGISAPGQAAGGKPSAKHSGRGRTRPVADADGDGGERRRGNLELAGTPGAGEGNGGERERDGDAVGDSGETHPRGNGYVSNTTPWWATADTDGGDDVGRVQDQERGTQRGEVVTGDRGGSRLVADTESIGRGEGRPEPEGFQGGSDVAISGRETSADTKGTEWGGAEPDDLGTAGGPATESGERPVVHDPINWGAYGPAINRWEFVLGRPAPRPTEPSGRDGKHRLSARFVEWMMGADDGWITHPDIWVGVPPAGARNAQLKAGGNGVVTLQAAVALTDMKASFEG